MSEQRRLLAYHQTAPAPVDGVHRIVLDRPEARNAISRRLLADLDAALDSVLAHAAKPTPSSSSLPPTPPDSMPASRAGSISGPSSASTHFSPATLTFTPARASSSNEGEEQEGEGDEDDADTSSSMASSTSTLVHPAPADPLRCLILESSSPAAFCAGADLIERRTMSESEVVDFLFRLRKLVGKLADFPVPTIAVLQGSALGGGLELALACDFRVGGGKSTSEKTRIGFPETHLGIIPGAGGTQRAPRLIGLSRAKELVYTGKLLDTREAHEWGIIDHLADEDEEAMQRALRLAQSMTRSAPLALASAKKAMTIGADLELEKALDWEESCYEVLLPTQDRREALIAFAEKRKPKFVGR